MRTCAPAPVALDAIYFECPASGARQTATGGTRGQGWNARSHFFEGAVPVFLRHVMARGNGMMDRAHGDSSPGSWTDSPIAEAIQRIGFLSREVSPWSGADLSWRVASRSDLLGDAEDPFDCLAVVLQRRARVPGEGVLIGIQPLSPGGQDRRAAHPN